MAMIETDKEAILEPVQKDRPRRRLRPRRASDKRGLTKAALLACGLLFLAGVVLAGTAQQGAAYLVSVDGSDIGFVKDKSLHEEVIRSLMEDESVRVGGEIRLGSAVTVQKAKPDSDSEILTDGALREALRACVSLLAKGFVISVNGRDVVALSSREDAEGVLSDLRGEYINAITSRQARVDEVLIKEKVDIEAKEVPTSIFRGREDASKVLARGTDKILNYTVKRGDSLWAIAAANHLTVDDLRKANPKVSGDLIREGDSLSLVVPEPYVTMSSRETLVFTVSIPYNVQVTSDDSLWPWQETVIQAGRSGQKEVTQTIIRENGKEVGRITVSERILSEPVTRKLVRGSKQVPPMGSDEMAWPVQGQITSNYGWRWGKFHKGVDIGAPSGTSVVAADSGMVSSAGWNGGYGNFVKINHGGGKETCYGHLSRMAVKTGDKVNKGDVIGYVGSTGISTGPHLHFEVWVDGKHKNPLSFYK